MPQPRDSRNLKLLKGVEPRELDNDHRPAPAAREPKHLPWFTVRQRAIWDETCTELREMHLLSSADRYAIAAYVALVAHLEDAVTQLNAEPEYVQQNKYTVSVAALLSAVDKLALRVNMLGSRLGLNPAARASIQGRTPVRENTELAHVRDLYA